MPETKFALLMVLLLALFPVSVWSIGFVYRLLTEDRFSPRVTYNNPWEFSQVRKPLIGEQQK